MKINLSDFPTRAPEKIKKDDAEKQMEKWKDELDILQNRLISRSEFSILVILQGLDASGKDGAIKKIFSGFNPLGISVKAFKKPTEEESKHDFLWRVHQEAPEKGMIRIFNRSHYEDVLVGVVEKWFDEDTVRNRYKHIRQFEELLQDNRTHILKFYLHCSDKERLERLNERLLNPEKKWKYNPGDMLVFEKRAEYIKQYEQIFENTSEIVEWQIIPSDQNWYKEYLITQSLHSLMMKLLGPL